MESPARSASPAVRGAAVIAVSVGVMNVATYAFTMAAARLLGPQPYGAFAALMGLLLVISVLALGLQATAARRIASSAEAAPGDIVGIHHAIVRVGLRASLGLGVVMLALAPLINQTLRLHSLRTAVLVAVCAVPLTFLGAQAGVLQGERRWAPLAVLYLASGVPRLVLGTALIWWRPEEFYALLGVTVTAFAPLVVGWWALREQARTPALHEPRQRDLWAETAHNSHALLAFFALSNLDVVVARNVMDGHQAGLYAGGLILTKAVLFLPQFVVVLAFPSMASAGAGRSTLVRSVSLVLVVGGLTVTGTAVLAKLTLLFVGGHQYVDIEQHLWMFALLGTFLSALQLVVYSVVARQARRTVYVVWLALGAVVLFGRRTGSYLDLLEVVLVIDTALFVLLMALSLYRLRNPVPEPATIAQ